MENRIKDYLIPLANKLSAETCRFQAEKYCRL